MSANQITKLTLAAALKECMKRQMLSQISVQNIVDACGLNRNSFYYHFKDKYELVNWIFDTESAPQFARTGQDIWQDYLIIFEFFYEHREFYACAFQDQGQNSFTEHFYKVFKAAFVDDVSDLFPNSEDQEFFAAFFLDSLLACIRRWLLGGAQQTPEEMTRLIKTAMTGAATMVNGESASE